MSVGMCLDVLTTEQSQASSLSATVPLRENKISRFFLSLSLLRLSLVYRKKELKVA